MLQHSRAQKRSFLSIFSTVFIPIWKLLFSAVKGE